MNILGNVKMYLELKQTKVIFTASLGRYLATVSVHLALSLITLRLNDLGSNVATGKDAKAAFDHHDVC